MTEVKESLRLGVFDINGTIHLDDTGLPDQIRDGFISLKSRSVDSTIITGRSIRRARELLSADWGTVVTPGVPFCVENGSRLVSSGGQNIRYHPLSKDEITSAIDSTKVAGDQIRYLAYNPENTNARTVLWTQSQDPKIKAAFELGHGLEYELLQSSLKAFAGRIVVDRPSVIIVGARSLSVEEAYLDSNVIPNAHELNVLSAGVDKSKGVKDISEVTGIPLCRMLVAGNDSNDIAMLNLPVRHSILVDGLGLVANSDLRVSSPVELGIHLQSMVRA